MMIQLSDTTIRRTHATVRMGSLRNSRRDGPPWAADREVTAVIIHLWPR